MAAGVLSGRRPAGSGAHAAFAEPLLGRGQRGPGRRPRPVSVYPGTLRARGTWRWRTATPVWQEGGSCASQRPRARRLRPGRSRRLLGCLRWFDASCRTGSMDVRVLSDAWRVLVSPNNGCLPGEASCRLCSKGCIEEGESDRESLKGFYRVTGRALHRERHRHS